MPTPRFAKRVAAAVGRILRRFGGTLERWSSPPGVPAPKPRDEQNEPLPPGMEGAPAHWVEMVRARAPHALRAGPALPPPAVSPPTPVLQAPRERARDASPPETRVPPQPRVSTPDEPPIERRSRPQVIADAQPKPLRFAPSRVRPAEVPPDAGTPRRRGPDPRVTSEAAPAVPPLRPSPHEAPEPLPRRVASVDAESEPALRPAARRREAGPERVIDRPRVWSDESLAIPPASRRAPAWDSDLAPPPPRLPELSAARTPSFADVPPTRRPESTTNGKLLVPERVRPRTTSGDDGARAGDTGPVRAARALPIESPTQRHWAGIGKGVPVERGDEATPAGHEQIDDPWPDLPAPRVPTEALRMVSQIREREREAMLAREQGGGAGVSWSE